MSTKYLAVLADVDAPSVTIAGSASDYGSMRLEAVRDSAETLH
ncbi:hypothetical protein [Microbacterium sp.]